MQNHLHLADAHTHLNMPEFAGEQESVCQRAWDAGVRLLINVGISVGNSREALATAQKYPWIYATVGVHPHGAAQVRPEDLKTLETLLTRDKVVALGEIGLDFYRLRSPAAVQVELFQTLLALAGRLGKPVVLHSREATPTMLAILRDFKGQLPGGLMHCFSGTYEEARQFLDLGLDISFSGVLTYPKARELQEAAVKLPLNRIHLETDAPYLAPQAKRGRRNEPAYLTFTARFLADLKKVSLAEVAAQTLANTCRLFGIPLPHI